MSHNTVNRGWLKRQIQSGNVIAKCNYHYTDDYAWDAAVDYQRTDWLPAYFNPPQRWELANPDNPHGPHHCVNNHERNPQGYISFDDHDLDSTSGRAYWSEDDGEAVIKLSVHSNLLFTLKLIEAPKTNGTRKAPKIAKGTPKAKIERFAQKVQADTNDYFARTYSNLAPDKVSVKYGPKYTKVDVGSSGRYLVENATERIYGIKAYGVVHHGKYFGTLDEIDGLFWGDFRGVYKVSKPAPAPRPASRFEGYYLEENN